MMLAPAIFHGEISVFAAGATEEEGATVKHDRRAKNEQTPTPAPSAGLACRGAAVKIDSVGTISVGCPKVWRSDRVFSVLDGIMRDVDSMTIRALEGLDANAANQAAIDLIQNSFDLTAKFDQAAAINNKFAVEKLKATRASEMAAFNADAGFRQKLIQQRNDLTLQLLDAQSKERQQIQAGANPTDIQKTKDLENSLQNQITNINSTLNTNPPSITDVPVASTPSTTINDTDRPQHATLDTMPQQFKDALASLLKQPTFPPAIAMDNVIDLLHQRIAREFAVIYDDLMRATDRYDVYLVQFDTSINPKPNARDRGVHVELSLSGCAGKEATEYPLAYELYPSAAAYNIMHGFNQTTHTGITGMAQTIVGWGLQASFQHDHSSLRSGLSQSIYASGFGAGQSTFGWDFAPAPNENRLAPGLRTTYAILRVPKGCKATIETELKADWPKRDRRYLGWNPLHWGRMEKSSRADQALAIQLPIQHPLQLAHVSYVPADTGEKGSGGENATPKPSPSPVKPAAAGGPPTPAGTNAAIPADVPPGQKPAVIQVRFRNPVDPNLIVTANDQILRRVRDVRGRGLYSDTTSTFHLAGNSAETTALSNSRFGLLESDTVGEDTWFQADSHTILLSIGRHTAGTDHFPIIRIIDPSSGGGSELTALAAEADEVRIGEWFFTQPGTLTTSSFQPLFTKPYDPGPFDVLVQTVGQNVIDLRIVSRARKDHHPIYLHDEAQIVIEADADNDRYYLPKQGDANIAAEPALLRPNWPMNCRQDRGALVCSMPLVAMRQFCAAATSRNNAAALSEPAAEASCLSNFKVWVDQAPYYGRAGLWGDADLNQNGGVKDLRAELIPRGTYRINEEKISSSSSTPEYMWTAELDLVTSEKNAKYCIPELTGSAEAAQREQSKAAQREQSKSSVDQNLWTPEHTQFWTQYFERTKSQQHDCQDANSQLASAFVVENSDHGIRIKVPFALFPQLPESLHLRKANSDDREAELPNLRERLIPRVTKVVLMGNKVFQLQGERMRAVDVVCVTAGKGGECKSLTIQSRSYSALQVDAGSLSDGTYAVQFGIGEGKFGDSYVDALQVEEDRSEAPLTLIIAK